MACIRRREIPGDQERDLDLAELADARARRREARPHGGHVPVPDTATPTTPTAITAAAAVPGSTRDPTKSLP